MDTFKIISIIFMMIVIYQIYQLNCTVFKDKVEGFEGAQQSLGGVDDTNSINTLAQIAKQLMTTGLTVPGNMTVQGDIVVKGKNIIAEGDIVVKGRNIIAELDKLNSRWNGNNLTTDSITATGSITLNNRGEWGNGLSIQAGTKEPAYINFMNRNGGRDGYIMMKPGGQQQNGA